MDKKPTLKELRILKKIEILNLLKNHTSLEVSILSGVPVQTVRNYKSQLNAYSEEEIKRSLRKLEDNLSGVDINLDSDYEKQNHCTPRRIYFHCYDCKFTANENNIKGIKEHLSRCKVNLKLLTEQTI